MIFEAGGEVTAFDPKADLGELEGPPRFQVAPDAYQAAQGVSAVVLLTGWPEFAELDFGRIKSIMKKPVILDAINFLSEKKLSEKGFDYMGVGR